MTTTSDAGSGEVFIPSVHLPALARRPALGEVETALGLLARALRIEGDEHVWVAAPDVASDEQDSGAAETDEAPERDASAAFELRHAQTWLTGCVRSGLAWCFARDDDGDAAAAALDKAAALLSVCAGKSASGAVTRIYHVPTPNGAEVAVSVRDATLSADALGSRTWGSAPLLARRLLSPLEAALRHSSQLRILELGAGTGLVGLALALYSQRLGIAAQVALTDYHPDVLSNLQFNASLNALSEPSTLVRRLDWQDDYAGASHAHETQTEEQRVAQTARDTWPSLESGSWDALVAADCCYEHDHALWLRAVASQRLSRAFVHESDSREGAGADLHGGLYILNALRQTHAHEAAAILAVFPLVDPRASSSGGALALRTVRTQDLRAQDDFGPPSMRTDVPLHGDDTVRRPLATQSGQATLFRAFEIRWCQVDD